MEAKLSLWSETVRVELTLAVSWLSLATPYLILYPFTHESSTRKRQVTR